MLKNVLTSIITHEFEKNVGKNQDPMFSKKTDDNFYAMDIELRLSTFKEEEGYRHLHIRIYGPHNYVAVLVKENWDVIPEGFIDYVNDCLFPGKDYTKSDTGWMLASYHDLCWTTDGVDSILYAYGNRITGIDTIGCGDGWYKKVLDSRGSSF